LLFGPVLAFRRRLEETAMLEKLGDVYREYQRTTPALFPFRWRGTR
jgi:protein-S-isoprenylcysteine O-methyltransferase Ste14